MERLVLSFAILFTAFCATGCRTLKYENLKHYKPVKQEAMTAAKAKETIKDTIETQPILVTIKDLEITDKYLSCTFKWKPFLPAEKRKIIYKYVSDIILRKHRRTGIIQIEVLSGKIPVLRIYSTTEPLAKSFIDAIYFLKAIEATPK